ncbi:MAG: radical SAM protein [Oscillospiraceae bacterium]|nr:radical SAM protein [Oscillospiraceae bacterium]
MFEMDFVSLVPSLNCNLKCKFCNARVPYLKNIKTHTVEEMMEMTDRMFKIVDLVHQITIGGGEVLLYKDLPVLIRELMRYKNQFEKIEIITNGTIVPSEELISAVKNCGEKFRRFLVDDYGRDLSKKVPEIVDVLEKNQIVYQVNDYWSENMYYGGWTDMGTYIEYIHTPEEASEITKKCVFSSSRGFCYNIHRGIADPCGKILVRLDAGLEVNPDEYIDLFDDSVTIEQQREKINRINSATHLDFCRGCNGLYPGCKRIKPAEQLTSEELQQIRQGLNKF